MRTPTVSIPPKRGAVGEEQEHPQEFVGFVGGVEGVLLEAALLGPGSVLVGGEEGGDLGVEGGGFVGHCANTEFFGDALEAELGGFLGGGEVGGVGEGGEGGLGSVGEGGFDGELVGEFGRGWVEVGGWGGEEMGDESGD